MARQVHVLKDRKGQQAGPDFARYQDAFNYRVSLNRTDLIVHEERR